VSPDVAFILEIPNSLHAIPRAVELVVGRCQTCESQARKFRFNFRVALTEALSNAMLYGNAGDPCKSVRLDVRLTNGRLWAQVTDQGAGFDPCAVEDPTLPENLTRPGGRGLFLMRKLLDEVHFNDCGNSVTLVMEVEGRPPLDEAASA
jgi:serine/threonine-protein kinase RsbW